MSAVANHHILDLFERARIDTYAARGDWLSTIRAAIRREFEGLTAFEQENFARDGVHLLGQRGMAKEMPIFAMQRNKIFWPAELQEDFLLFLAGVAGNVNRRRAPAFVVNQNASPEKMIDHAEDRFLVARKLARRTQR